MDNSGGLIVVDAAGEDQARALYENDPAVRDGIMVAEAHPWKLMMGIL